MEIGVDITEGSSYVGEDKIFVAVGNVMEEATSTLLWALQNFRRKLNICILHVHQPAQEIRVLGVKFRVEGLDAQQVRAHREKEKKDMHDVLNDYLDVCLHAGVRAETIYIEKDNIERGIVELITQHGIKKLVMGAAADRHYSNHMTRLRSQKANFVFHNAPMSCHIWFTCRHKVIVTREAVSENSAMEATATSPSPLDRPHCKSFSHSVGLGNLVHETLRRVKSANTDITGGSVPLPRTKSQSPKKGLTNPVQDIIRRAMSRNSEPSRGRPRTSASSSSSSSSSSSEGNAEIQTPRSRSQSTERSSSRLSIGSSAPTLRDDWSDDELVVSSLSESIENLVELSPANELSLAKESESLRGEGEKKGRKEQLERERQELDILRRQRDQVMEEVRVAQDRKVKLESQSADYDRMVAELVEKKVLSGAQQLVAIRKEVDELMELRRIREEEFVRVQRPQFFSVFSAVDIESATESFNPSLKIGGGAFGNVYKGVLRQTPVAIKKFHFHSLEEQSSSDFQCEVDVLSMVRHPNLVTLIGACPEASALVFEYLPNGSLEDRLTCKDGTPPLSSKDRIRIAKEICSALIFLHSNRPDIIVHGDLKPSNILLDVNFVSKLGDFGIAKLIPRDENTISTAALYCTDDIKGTISYIDPVFVATGVLTSKADVYSFGVVLLQLLTGGAARGLSDKVQLALDEGNLNAILDTSAGKWPLVQAKQLAQMALRCCELNPKNRPNLELEVWKLFQSMENQI